MIKAGTVDTDSVESARRVVPLDAAAQHDDAESLRSSGTHATLGISHELMYRGRGWSTDEPHPSPP